MQAPNEPDMYADVMEPVHTVSGITYRVHVPNLGSAKYQYDYWANVYVEPGTGYCEMHGWKWGEYRQPRPAVYSSTNWHLLEVEKRVWEWLVEWELIELKPIGPDDAEYFATPKLTGE